MATMEPPVARPARRLRRNPTKPQAAKIELIDKHIDHPNRIVLVDSVLQTLREQRALPPIHTLYKAFHETSPIRRESIHRPRVFTQAGS